MENREYIVDWPVVAGIEEEATHGELIRCKDCKHFSKEDYFVDIGNGRKLLAGGDVPTCKKWGNGCYTREDGYCYLAERRTE